MSYAASNHNWNFFIECEDTSILTSTDIYFRNDV